MRLSLTSHLMILTGAGISQESGIQTFRDGDGLWHQHRLEDVCTPEGYLRNPQLVHEFYNARRKQALDPSIRPNLAHHALVTLQQKWPGNVTLVTQNIDCLHEQAGHENVIHMHGAIDKVRCLFCDSVTSTKEACGVETSCHDCQRSGGVRPDIVWFGEMPYHLPEIQTALEDADMFIAIGTSGTVYPAAGFVSMARQSGATTIEINLEPDTRRHVFDKGYYGPATRQVPLFVQEILTVLE